MVRDVDQLLAFEVLVFQHGQLVRVEKVLERLMVWVRVDLFTRPKNPNCLSQSLRTPASYFSSAWNNLIAAG